MVPFDHFLDSEGNEVTIFPSSDIDHRLFLTANDTRLNKTEAKRLADALLQFVESQKTIIETVTPESYGSVYDNDLDEVEVTRPGGQVTLTAPIRDGDGMPTGALLTASFDPDSIEELVEKLIKAKNDAIEHDQDEDDRTNSAFFD